MCWRLASWAAASHLRRPPPPECEADADCDDGNECTWERCDSWDDSCYRVDLNQAPCDFDGLAGWCIDGVCSEDLCAGVVCDDGNECTRGECRFPDGSCEHRQLTYISGCDFDGSCRLVYRWRVQ